MHTFISKSTNPILNLAMESYLFRQEPLPFLFLYINDPCVVIGRNQNPLVEVDIHRCHNDQIPIIRRYSGGGTVFHDNGNLNYCLATAKTDFQRDKGVEYLQTHLQLPTTISKRHDLLFQGKKISGSAFKLTQDRCYHHGTLLCQSNLTFGKYLHAPNLGIHSKAFTSVRMDITNLGIDPQEAILQLKTDKVTQLEERQFLFPDMNETIDELGSYEWTFERTPLFEQRLDIKGKEEWMKARHLKIVESSLPELIGQDYLSLQQYQLSSEMQAVLDVLQSNK